MGVIGHNNGPTMEGGTGWRRHCWRKARKDLLPQLPLQIVRIRVQRAKDLGLDYKTYATVRATSGHDIIAFLFSNNALRLHRAQQPLPPERADKLAAQRDCARLLAAHAPLDGAQLVDQIAAQGVAFADGFAAPRFTDSWSDMRDQLTGALRAKGLSSKSVLMVGETAVEREWSPAARMAGYLSGDSFFQDTPLR